MEVEQAKVEYAYFNHEVQINSEKVIFSFVNKLTFEELLEEIRKRIVYVDVCEKTGNFLFYTQGNAEGYVTFWFETPPVEIDDLKSNDIIMGLEPRVIFDKVKHFLK